MLLIYMNRWKPIVLCLSALGQAVTLAKSIAKYPQASLLYDRSALFRTAYANIEWESEDIGEAIRTEMRDGLKVYRAGWLFIENNLKTRILNLTYYFSTRSC